VTEHVGWSWIFFVNVPAGTLALVASFVLIVESRSDESGQHLDLPGLATSAAGLLALVYSLIEANRYGWTSPRILGLFLAAAVLLTTFVAIESRSSRPMLDLTLFRDPTFSGANVAALLVSLAMFGIFFFVSLYMQNILGYSPFHAGLVFLPMSVLVVVTAPLAGKATDLIGPRWPIAIGMSLLAVGLVSFSRLGAHASFTDLLPGMLIGGVGMGVAMGPMTTAALSAVSTDDARRRIRGTHHLPPGRRRARHRGHGRPRRRGDRRADQPALCAPVRRRLPARARDRRRDRARRQPAFSHPHSVQTCGPWRCPRPRLETIASQADAPDTDSSRPLVNTSPPATTPGIDPQVTTL
jgi:predicted MFS family arabinose efflux permease